jgi:hypothetical protein
MEKETPAGALRAVGGRRVLRWAFKVRLVG